MFGASVTEPVTLSPRRPTYARLSGTVAATLVGLTRTKACVKSRLYTPPSSRYAPTGVPGVDEVEGMVHLRRVRCAIPQEEESGQAIAAEQEG